MARRFPAVAASLSLLVAIGALVVQASDEDDELMPGKITLIRPGKVAKFVAKPDQLTHPLPFELPSPSNDPTVEGGRLDIFDTGGGAGSDTYPLPAPGWSALGNPPGSTGYKFRGGPSDACRVVLVKTKVVKGVCKGAGVTLAPPFTGDVGVVLTVGTDSKRYCATFGGQTVKNTSGLLKRRNAPASGCVTTTTTTTHTATSTTTSSTLPGACCSAERLTLTGGSGTLVLGNLPPFPIPAGVQATLDTGPATVATPECRHDVIVPAGGLVVPTFQVSNLNYCTTLTSLGCESGGADGRGTLWDGSGAPGLALTNVTRAADTSDGTCNPPGQPCNSSAGGAGANSLGQLTTTRAASGSSGLRTTFDIPVRVRIWSDSVCSPFIVPGCCATATFDPALDATISVFDSVLSLTTDTATGLFTDMNGDGCVRVGAGFGAALNGPVSLTGSPAAGPCCTVGQPTTLAAVGPAFGGAAPFYDLAFQVSMPSTISSCGVAAAGSCTLTTDPCLGFP